MEEGREKHRSNRQKMRKENKEEKRKSKAVSNQERSKKWNGAAQETRQDMKFWARLT